MDVTSLLLAQEMADKRWPAGVPVRAWPADDAPRKRVQFENEQLEQFVEDMLLAAERPWLRNQANAREIRYKGPYRKPPRSYAAPENGKVPGAPTFASDAMYGVVGEIVDVLKVWTEAPPVSLFVSLLASAGSRIAPGAWFSINETRHHTRLWFGVIGGTGTARKGTARDIVVNVMDDTLPSEDPRDYVRRGLSSGEGLKDLFESVPDQKLLVFESEFGRFVTVATREGNILSFVCRDLWDDTILQNFSKNTKIDLRDAHLTFIGQTTMEEFLAKMPEIDIYSGALNRFIFMWAEREHLIPNAGAIADRRLEPLIERLREGIELGRELGEVKLSKQARIWWTDFYVREISERPHGQLHSITARWEVQILRVALTFAALEGSALIKVAHLEAGASLWEYSMASAALLVGQTTGSRKADKVLAALRAAEGCRLEQITIRRELFSNNVSAAQLDAVLEVLEPYGVTRATEREGRVGRPSQVWSLNEVGEGD